MKRNFRYLLLAALAVCSCTKSDRQFVFADPDEVQNFRIEGLTLDNFPFVDCSTSTSPLRDIVMYNLLDIPYSWGKNLISGAEYWLYFDLPEGMESGSPEYEAFVDRLYDLRQYSGSHEAYVNLIDGVTDVIIDSRDISRNEEVYAREKGVAYQTKPLAWDALVFIVHPQNRVKSLTQKQIRDIYAGRITNWKQVGGADHEIHPYMRNADSGSQEKMETLGMHGEAMADRPEMIGGGMMSPYYSIEADEWGIGYTPHYYCERMVGDLRHVKVLAVDKVYPSAYSILGGVKEEAGGYPYVTSIYAAVRRDPAPDPLAEQLYDWLSTPAAKDLIDESGYISRRSHALGE